MKFMSYKCLLETGTLNKRKNTVLVKIFRLKNLCISRNDV